RFSRPSLSGVARLSRRQRRGGLSRRAAPSLLACRGGVLRPLAPLGLRAPAELFSASGRIVAVATRDASLAALVASAASVGMLVLTGQSRLAGLFLLLALRLYIPRGAHNVGLAGREEA